MVSYTGLVKNLINDLNLKKIIPGCETQYYISMLSCKDTDNDEDNHLEQSLR